jgi:hypothetical protein
MTFFKQNCIMDIGFTVSISQLKQSYQVLEFTVGMLPFLVNEKNCGIPESLADHLKSALFIINKVFA